ncbi:MAG: hypothetical protein JWO58_217 [Chitinophagaceae bacterium]|nr:hypothetical protein [Chitinophagaceae bacterium]
MKDFYTTFQSFADEQLFTLVLQPKDYKEEAIATARFILKERRLETLLQEKEKQQQQFVLEQEQQEYEQVVESAKYYKDLVHAREHGVSFNVPLTEIPAFEGELTYREIPFFKEDKNIGPGVESYPTQKYFFDPKYSEAVDELVKQSKINTIPYHSNYTMRFQMLALVALCIAIVLFFAIVFIFG